MFAKTKISRLYPNNWPNFIVWLPLLLEILGNMRIVITCCPVCGVMNFQINHSFLIKPFFYMIKKLGKKCKHLKNEKGFFHEIKSIFHYFLRTVIERNNNEIFTQ